MIKGFFIKWTVKIVFVFFPCLILAQQNKSNNADCNKALKIDIYDTPEYRPVNPPKGSGDLIDLFGSNKSDKYLFEKEHHTAWYRFDTKHAGELCFDINPDLATDDYDFLLFKVNVDGGCEEILNKTLLPLRTNIARNKPSQLGKTGLSTSAPDEYQKAGIGNNYSKSIQVKPQETYLLVLDNVYNNNGNHSVIFKYNNKPSLKVVVQDEVFGNTIDATVSHSANEKTIELAHKKEDGLLIPLSDLMAEKNNLIIFSKGYMYENIEIKPSEVLNGTETTRVIKLKKLKEGGAFVLKNLNFYGNKSTLIPGAEKSLDELLLLMKLNASIKIKIDGHVNGCESIIDVNKLSYDRANTVREFLVNQGVEENRIETEGFGCSKMLYPNAVNEMEQALNRRVEVHVLSL